MRVDWWCSSSGTRRGLYQHLCRYVQSRDLHSFPPTRPTTLLQRAAISVDDGCFARHDLWVHVCLFVFLSLCLSLFFSFSFSHSLSLSVCVCVCVCHCRSGSVCVAAAILVTDLPHTLSTFATLSLSLSGQCWRICCDVAAWWCTREGESGTMERRAASCDTTSTNR